MNGILLGIWLSACSGDAITTHAALQRGAYEVIMTQNSGINTAIIGAQATLLPLFLVPKVEKHWGKRAARIMVIAAISVRVFAVANNLHVLSMLP